MGRKGVPGKKTGARQSLARRKALDYIQRLGTRRAAGRLETTVKELQRWLDEGFPKSKLEAAIGLGKPGGSHTIVRGARLGDLVKKKGLRSVAALTGISVAELKSAVKKKPRSYVKIERKRLNQALKKKGADKLADLLGTKRDYVQAAAQIPQTKATLRLKNFVAKLGSGGHGKVASYLGITPTQLARWLKTNIPPAWEADVNLAIGKRVDQVPDIARVERKRDIEREVAAALKKAREWNRKAPARHRIKLKDAERWARIGRFDEQLAAIKGALQAAKKKPPRKPVRPKPPPPKPAPPSAAPPKAHPPAPPTPPAPPGKPPKPPKAPPSQPPREPPTPKDIQDFLQARYDAFAAGKFPAPEIPWGRAQAWKLINRQGYRVYKKVQKFVHQIDLHQMGTDIIKLAKKVWRMINGSARAMMTIRFVFSVKGFNNPFYPDAFVAGDTVSFHPRNLKIDYEWEIESRVREIMHEIYSVDSEVTMLFLEYYEVIKSVPVDEQQT